MNTSTIKKTRWFWPWQDEKEEAWLGEMSLQGWHLKSVQFPCVYTFEAGAPGRYTYRLDYMPTDKATMPDYLQIFQDAGWAYIGELSNWRYWRKQTTEGESNEIFTDNESKLRKYRRLLGYMAFFLVLLVFLGSNLLRGQVWTMADPMPVITAIYLVGIVLYAIIIPIYIVVVIKLLQRVNQLKKKLF
jgi:hypothetical protein